jgi:hypothetical protein
MRLLGQRDCGAGPVRYHIDIVDLSDKFGRRIRLRLSHHLGEFRIVGPGLQPPVPFLLGWSRRRPPPASGYPPLHCQGRKPRRARERVRVIGEAAPQIAIGLFSLRSMGVMSMKMRTKVFFCYRRIPCRRSAVEVKNVVCSGDLLATDMWSRRTAGDRRPCGSVSRTNFFWIASRAIALPKGKANATSNEPFAP